MSKKTRKCVRCARRMRAGAGWMTLDAASVVCPDCQRTPRVAAGEQDPLYTYVDGEPMLSTEGMAVLFGIPLPEVEAEMLESYGATAAVERSGRITWPTSNHGDPKDAT